MQEGFRRVEIILGLLGENPDLTVDEVDREIDNLSNIRQKQGKILPSPRKEYVSESKKRISQRLQKKTS